MTAAKTPTARAPAAENRFKTAPLAGAGASEGDPEPEEGTVAAAGDDDGGEGGESATGDVEGEADGEVVDGEGAAVGGVLDGEGAAGEFLGESAGDLAGDDAGDCAPVEASRREAISTITTPLNRAIVERERENSNKDF
ncbi:hypothetical protein ACFX13_031285 [Malus domestica]